VARGRPLLVLVDGHSLLYRAYHALPNSLRTRTGEPTNAVYGFTSMLLAVLREQAPEYALVALDVGPSFRQGRYEQYKANRAEMPDDLQPQVERAREVLDALSIPVIGLEGWEADDIIGTVARQAKEAGAQVLIVTGDTDAFQLIDCDVRVLTCGRRFSDTKIYDIEAVRERYGLMPAQLIDYKALVGDKSDNVPGVRGVGEKTAARLLSRYGTLEAVYEHLDEIASARTRKALEAGRQDALMSKDLVTIRRDVPLEFTLEQCRVGQADVERVKSIFRELEFHSLMQRVTDLTDQGQLALFGSGSLVAGEKTRLECNYRVVSSEQELAALAEALGRADTVALDVESDGLDSTSAGLVGISLAYNEGEGWYLPVAHRSPGAKNIALEEIRDTLGSVLEDERLVTVAHNGKFDWELLWRHGLNPTGPDFDTMVAEWVLNPSSRALSLKNLAWTRLGVDMTPITDLIGSGKKQKSMADISIAEVGQYAAADADMTLRLKPILEADLKERDQWHLFKDIEMRLLPVLADMELAGVKVDVEYLREFSKELGERLQRIVDEIRTLAGYPINVNSTQQLSDLLFKQLGLPCEGLRRTTSGRYSTAAEVLEGLQGEHPVVDLILEYRQLAKLKSTYVDALPNLVHPDTGRVHTSYNQTATVTGRLSSSDPNLQNIPIRTELGRRVRRAFVAEAGNMLVGADYSQVELRILAHVSEDPELMKAFAEGLDIHASTAALIYGVPLDEVTPEMRRLAKTVNFAVIYGVSAYGLARQSDLTQSEARVFIEAYFRTYPKVREYLESTKAEAARKGYVETLLGRRRYFPELAGKKRVSHAQRGEAERAAINMPVQGTAADIIKIAMIRLHDQLRRENLKTRMILQVHDELVLEGPEEEVGTVAPLVRNVMENAFPLRVPLKVDLSIGQNWLDMK